jgi:hypothetical protein
MNKPDIEVNLGQTIQHSESSQIRPTTTQFDQNAHHRHNFRFSPLYNYPLLCNNPLVTEQAVFASKEGASKLKYK